MSAGLDMAREFRLPCVAIRKIPANAHQTNKFLSVLYTYTKEVYPNMKQISGNKLLVKALKEEGVEYLFGYPGACTIDISD